MPKTSHYQTKEEKKLLLGIEKKYGISRSRILGMALAKYAEILEQGGELTAELKSVARKATLSRKLQELRNDGKLLARDIAYAASNRRRALKAIDESEMTQDEKKYWRNIIEEHAKKRKQLAEELLNPNKGGIPPKESSKEEKPERELPKLRDYIEKKQTREMMKKGPCKDGCPIGPDADCRNCTAYFTYTKKFEDIGDW